MAKKGVIMAAIDDLIKQIEDPGLRARIAQEFHKVNKKKKFGLVFEEHLPEATPLYDIPIKRGALVAEKQGEISDIYVVTNIDVETNTVTCRWSEPSPASIRTVREDSDPRSCIPLGKRATTLTGFVDSPVATLREDNVDGTRVYPYDGGQWRCLYPSHSTPPAYS